MGSAVWADFKRCDWHQSVHFFSFFWITSVRIVQVYLQDEVGSGWGLVLPTTYIHLGDIPQASLGCGTGPRLGNPAEHKFVVARRLVPLRGGDAVPSLDLPKASQTSAGPRVLLWCLLCMGGGLLDREASSLSVLQGRFVTKKRRGS